MTIRATGLVALMLAAPLHAQEAAGPAIESLRAEIRAIMEDARSARHVPGTVYGIVKDGRLVVVEGLGVRDPATGGAVDADTRFRIASMSKAFTALAILKLRDEGKLSLEESASRYVPELRGWETATGDARPISVRDLLHHTAGFVEDNPWGDRQQVLTEAEFSALMKGGMAFANAPGVRNEYSNYGYALLGRIISNVSGRRFQDYIRDTIMRPLGMVATGFDIAESPEGSRAIGSRWKDDNWLREPDMRDGAFGAMGGVETTANDYARWIAFLLSAWPARDGPETGPVRRSTVRDLVALGSPSASVDRSPEIGAPCRQGVTYGGGLRIVSDCDLGRVLTHTGGYPGYGSQMMLLPDAGVGMFVFNNLTYTSLSNANFRAMIALRKAGAIPDRALPVSEDLAKAYALAKGVWSSGTLSGVPLANNVLMDFDATGRGIAIRDLKAAVGACTMDEAIKPISAMEGAFTWRCANGRVSGRVQQAPTRKFQLQVIEFRLSR